MKKIAHEIWKKRTWIADGYALLIVAILPLYMKDGLNMIGDAKYSFFLNSTLFFLGLTACMILVGTWSGELGKPASCTRTELFVVFFAVATLLSTAFSTYRDTAISGYVDWHMGAVSQLSFVFVFFLMRRWSEKGRFVFVADGIATLVVCILTVLNRCGNDPLGVYRGMDWFEWNRRNLLATIGNINWLCCYLAVSVPVLLYFYWRAEGGWRIPAWLSAFIGVGAIMLQGSDAGYVDLAVFLWILVWFSADSLRSMIRVLDLVILIPLFWSIFSIFRIDLITPHDVDIIGRMYTKLWLIPLIVLVLINLGLRYLTYHVWKDISVPSLVCRVVHGADLLLVVCMVFLVLLCNRSDAVWNMLGSNSLLRFSDTWGSFRGALWKTAGTIFQQASIVQKLYGFGPDCFAYAFENIGAHIVVAGQWENAIYANAHNEWLTMLVNEGILGSVGYFGIFGSVLYGMLRNWRRSPELLLGVLILAGYICNNAFAFQQTISTPIIFIVMGICDRMSECA